MQLMTKAELGEMLEDLKVFSGHVWGFRGVKKKKTFDGFHIEGKVKTTMAEFRFMVLGPFTNCAYWQICLEDAAESLNSGGIVYRTYSFPKLARNPELKRKVIAANRIIEILTNPSRFSGDVYAKGQLPELYEIVKMPKGLSRPERVKFCEEKIKMAHLPKQDYVRN